MSEDDGRRAHSREFRGGRYVLDSFWERERTAIFDRTWRILARESQVAVPGTWVPLEDSGDELLVVRGQDGVVRVFVNACRHRGTRLVERRCVATTATCPYHGWRYAADGTLVSVPKKDGFAAGESRFGNLLPVRSACFAGFVWINRSPDAPDLPEHLGDVEAQLRPYRLEDMYPAWETSYDLECNWKAVLDQATETYHVGSVHGRSIGRFVDTAAETVATFYGLDVHHLQTLPVLETWWRPSLDRWSNGAQLPLSEARTRYLHKYLVFPNTIINLLPYYMSVYRVTPMGAGRCRLHYGFYLRRRGGVIATLRGAATLAASLFILREDLRLLPEYQRGVASLGDLPLHLHREEAPLAYFHRVVDRFLAT